MLFVWGCGEAEQPALVFAWGSQVSKGKANGEELMHGPEQEAPEVLMPFLFQVQWPGVN